ncbi:cupin domain-containing protein [Deinococcus ruber]|uniref:Cupin type-1 domain-containing protein n=1 Tax=Deinococcus ruber TaxID=1848197 RepID=A0A918F612_9DEIO|nr:cupin domain-containing protein [Deinococcus ruber]GGR11554.1 hypothetical protein GCM10008957_25630 [Deinococcus ruber]
MNPTPQTAPVPRLIRADQGNRIINVHDEVTFKLTGPDTGGVFALGLATTQPGGGPPPHRHSREDELFIVVEGEIQCGTVNGWLTARAGDVVYLPAGSVHTFHNASDAVAKHWILVTPPGFETFFERFTNVLNAAQGGAPDMAALHAAAGDFGIDLLPPHALPAR